MDIVTSSSVLAERDSKEQANFFNMLGISCSHNCTKQDKGFKECYGKDVVYGDSLNFQADLLRTEFRQEGIRGERGFNAVIVDEVDSMLIDEAAKIAKLAMPICGMEHLETVFIFISSYLNQLNLSEEDLKDEELAGRIEEELTGLIERIISPGYGIVIPNFLKGFVLPQCKNWAKSALTSLKMKENVDYVIAKDINGQQIIAPVDYNSTGVVQTGTSWAGGLHQFLQIKHLLRLTPESLTTSFISNMSFFKKYGSGITGMTGTLGSLPARELLEVVYNLDTAIVPTFKPKIFELQEGMIAASKDEHLRAVITRAIEESNKGRGVLIIAETIEEGLKLAEELKKGGDGSKLRQYLRSDETQGNYNSFDNKCGGGDIIVATNLAGRGTDILTSRAVEEAGGLHVIITFLPNNLRVEEQALGRTSRQGNQGSGELIINGEEAKTTYGNFNTFAELKAIRDGLESARLELVRAQKVQSMEFEDNLFTRFNLEIYQPLKTIEDNPQKLMQLEDLWGFWLLEQKTGGDQFKNPERRFEVTQNFEQFKQQMVAKYISGASIFVNPAYMSNYALNKFGNDPTYAETNALLSDPNAFDPSYSYQMHYLKAYSELRYNDTIKKQTAGGTRWRQETLAKVFKSLSAAQEQLEEVIIPQTQSALLQLGPDSLGSPLQKQFDNKLRLLDTAVKNIKENIQYINDNNRPGENTIVIENNSLKFYSKLFENEINSADIAEFANFGLSFLYHAGYKNYTKDFLTGTLVAIAGIAQVVAGAVIAVGSLGFASQFGIGLAAGGIGDIIKGASAALEGKGVDLSNWVKNKGIELGVNLAISAISSTIAAARAGQAGTAAKGVSSGAGAAGTLSTEAVIKGLTATEFGVAIGTRIATSYIVDFAAKKLEQAAAKPIKGEIKALEQAIRISLQEQETNRKMQAICLTDSLHRPGGHKQQFQTEVLSVIDRKSSQFADIAQVLMSSAVSSQVAASGGGLAGAAAVTIASAGVSAARGIGDIQALKDYLLSGIESAASSVYMKLPDFKALLCYSCRGITEDEASSIVQKLQESGIIQVDTINKRIKVDLSKIDQIAGGERVLQQEAAAKQSKPSNYQTTANTTTTTTTTTTTQSLSSFTMDPPVSSSNVSRSKDAPVSNKWKLQVQELLTDIATAFSKNYSSEIDQVAANISLVVSDRMKGLIRSGIITPITSAVVNTSLNYVLEEKGLRKTIEDIIDRKGAGVAAGDEPQTLRERLFGEREEHDLESEYASDDPNGKNKWKEPDNQNISSEDKWQALTPKTLGDIGRNLLNDFCDPSKKFFMNVPAACLGAMGEFSEWTGENIVFAVSRHPAGQYVLESIGNVVGAGLDVAYSAASKGAKLVLSQDQISSLVKNYQELPHGWQVLGNDIASGTILLGAGKIAGASFKLAKDVKLFKDPVKALDYKGPVPIFEKGNVLNQAEMNLHNIAKHPAKAADYEGKLVHFATRDEARQFAPNPEVQKQANKFFGQARNKFMEQSGLPKYDQFNVKFMQNGDYVMEFIAKSDNPDYMKRYIYIVDREGRKLLDRKETISLLDDTLKNLKFR